METRPDTAILRADIPTTSSTHPLPTRRTLWRQPLPYLHDQLAVRWACRTVLTLFRHQLVSIEGLEHIHPANDPFIVAINHSQRPEAVLVPAWFVFFRRGRQIHFLADWNFLMLPGIGFLLRLNDPIIVGRKSARPRWLNVFKPWLTDLRPSMDQARIRLRRQMSVGVFPEGTVNRNPNRLMRGLTGTARLSLETGLPIVPVGIRFPDTDPQRPIRDWHRFSIHIGAPMTPPAQPASASAPMNPSSDTQTDTSADRISHWHGAIMMALAQLSGKTWSHSSPRTKHENQTASGCNPSE